MHIRHFILMGAMLGAAVFLPDQAFAEKNRAPEPQHSDIHTQGLDHIEKPKASEKIVSATPKPKKEDRRQGGADSKPVTNPATHKTVPVKPAPKQVNKSNRPVEKGRPPSMDQKERAPVSAEKSVKLKGTGKAGSAKPKAVTTKLPVVPESPESYSSNKSKRKANSETPTVHAEPEVTMEDTESPASLKTGRSHKVGPKPLTDEENKTGNHPEDIEVVNNSPQRTGGPSQETFSSGASQINFIAHWFDWDLHLTLGSIYHSREVQFGYQWINAPPSPPPESALFLNVNDVSNDM